MTTDEVAKSQELILALAEELVFQQESIVRLKRSLDEYRSFLNKQIKELTK